MVGRLRIECFHRTAGRCEGGERVMGKRILPLLLLLLLAVPGRGADQQKVAVLELVNRAGITDDKAYYLTALD